MTYMRLNQLLSFSRIFPSQFETATKAASLVVFIPVLLRGVRSLVEGCAAVTTVPALHPPILPDVDTLTVPE